MASQQKQLFPGLKINLTCKRSSLYGAFLYAGFLAIITLLSFDAVGYALLPFAVMPVWMLVSGLLMEDVAVLDGGLDIGGRTVPFSSITNIKIKSGRYLRLTYEFEGKVCRTSLCTNWLSGIILSRLAVELGTAAGLTAFSRSKPVATPSS